MHFGLQKQEDQQAVLIVSHNPDRLVENFGMHHECRSIDSELPDIRFDHNLPTQP